jgi:hypothetical protein
LFASNINAIEGIKYYGNIEIENGSTGIYNGNKFSTGDAIDYPTLGWNNGQIINLSGINRNLMINPINTNGEYLLSRSGSNSINRGYQMLYTGSTTEKYSYGKDIYQQSY